MIKMQENPLHPVAQGPTAEDHEGSQSPLMAPQTHAKSPPADAATTIRVEEVSALGSPKNNGVPAILTPTGPASSGSGSNVNVAMPQGSGGRQDFPPPVGNITRGSSCESLPESHVYPVPIKFRSTVGPFEEHVACGFANLYASSELSDVTIACEGKLIKAHKLVLSISSPYFRQIFEELHDYPCLHPVVILHGVKLKDWESIMRLIYCGIVHVNSNEIDDFISTAECLRIDGLAAEDPCSSSHDDITPPHDYLQRFAGHDSFHHSGDSGPASFEEPKSRTYESCSEPEDFSTPKDYRFERSPEPSVRRNSDLDRSHRLRYASTHHCSNSSSSRVRVISSAQSSPGVGSLSNSSLLKIDTHDGHQDGEAYDGNRPPSCPEGLRAFSQQSSPVESHVKAIRHSVISRRRDVSESAPDDVIDNSGPVPSDFSSSSRMVMSSRNLRPSPYPTGWEHRNITGSEAIIVDESDRQGPTIVSDRRSPPLPPSLSSSCHGVTSRYPLSVISRQPPAAIPLQHLLTPAAAGFLHHRMPQLQMLAQGPRSPHGESSMGTGISSLSSSPLASPQSQEQQQSTLAILRAKIAAGQQIYSRGYRPDRHQTHVNPFIPRFPPVALGSASQLSPQELGAGSSRPSHYVPQGMTSPPQSVARPKTKAIRSSQVPQSARYTAAEVDAMVDKVQNFPGNSVPCELCSKFVKRERLRAHIHECHLLHGKRIICGICGIGLKSKGSYRVHIWRHKRGTLPSSRQHRHGEPQ